MTEFEATKDVSRADASFRRHLRLAMAWPLVASVASGAVLIAMVLGLLGLNRWVDHTDRLIGQAHLAEKIIVDDQSHFRGYLLTGEKTHSDLYQGVDVDVLPVLDRLLREVARDSEETATLSQVRADVLEWSSFAEQQLRLKKAGASIEELGPKLDEGANLMNAIRARLDRFIELEETLRAERVERADVVTRYALLCGLVLFVVVGSFIAFSTKRHMRSSSGKYRRAFEVQRRVARFLRDSEERLRRAEEAAKMGAWNRNLVSGELILSSRCKELLGLGDDAKVNLTKFMEKIHPDDREGVNRAVLEALKNRLPYDAEFRVPLKGGTVRWLAQKGEATFDPNGRAVSMAGMILDITDRKLAEEALREANAQLRDANRHKDEFLAVLSHELRNPLAPIRNSVYLLAHSDANSDKAIRARNIISRQVNHLARLVEDLLDVKRISTGKLRLHPVLMDLTLQLREAVEDMRPLFARRRIALELLAPKEDIWVKGDRTRLAQVVSNLLHNASKFTDSGGRVSVKVEKEGGQIFIRVRDDGVGLPPDMKHTIFDAFVQGDRTLHRSGGGLGLGLSLVRGITELHGGRVSVESEGLGKGTEFVVQLPVASPGEVAIDFALAPIAPVRRRVLVVEDNLDAAESLKDVLESVGGHEVMIATDGQAGIEAAQKYAPDVILCDIGLPVVDGLEVARRLRAEGQRNRTRLVALSGYASAEDVEKALRAGFDYHMVKPPDLEALLALIADASRAGAVKPVPAELRTGHHEVDAQHASVLDLTHRLRSTSKDAIWDTLRFLAQYTVTHFEYEEKLMEDVSYPDFAVHRQRHSEFLTQLRDLEDVLEREGATPENVAKLADAVEAWVAAHVLDCDRRLAEFVRNHDSRSRVDCGEGTSQPDPPDPLPDGMTG